MDGIQQHPAQDLPDPRDGTPEGERLGLVLRGRRGRLVYPAQARGQPAALLGPTGRPARSQLNRQATQTTRSSRSGVMAVRWVSIPDQYNEAGEVVPTRLVIHQRGLKIDFAFYTMAMLPKVERNGGYSVLLDKLAGQR